MKSSKYCYCRLLWIMLLGLLLTQWSCASDPSSEQAKTSNETPATRPSPPPKAHFKPPPSEVVVKELKELPKASESVDEEDSEEGETINKSAPIQLNPQEYLQPQTPQSKGVLLYAVPDSMTVQRPERVYVRIARSLKVEQMKALKKRLPATAQAKTDTIITGEIMDIQLSEPDTLNPKFRIASLQESEQILDPDNVGYWSWSVTPLVAGRHSLLVRVGIKQYSEQFQKEGYRYIPVWEKQVEVENDSLFMAAKRPADIPDSYGEESNMNRAFGGPEKEITPAASFPWLPIGIGAGLLLVGGLWFWQSKKGGVTNPPPPIPKEKLDAIDQLIKKDKLETALEALETLVIVVRDKEHNQLISYQAELESFEQKYKGGEITFEEYSRVRARIRRALIEMNDRLVEG